MPAPGGHRAVSELYRTHPSAWERQTPQMGLTATPSFAPLPDSRDRTSGDDGRLLCPLPRGPRTPLPSPDWRAASGAGAAAPAPWGAFSSGRLSRASQSRSFFVTCLCHPSSPQPSFTQGTPSGLSHSSGSQYHLELSRKGTYYHLERRTDEGQVPSATPSKLCDLRQAA